jgi:hypothetical protein
MKLMLPMNLKTAFVLLVSLTLSQLRAGEIAILRASPELRENLKDFLRSKLHSGASLKVYPPLEHEAPSQPVFLVDASDGYLPFLITELKEAFKDPTSIAHEKASDFLLTAEKTFKLGHGEQIQKVLGESEKLGFGELLQRLDALAKLTQNRRALESLDNHRRNEIAETLHRSLSREILPLSEALTKLESPALSKALAHRIFEYVHSLLRLGTLRSRALALTLLEEATDYPSLRARLSPLALPFFKAYFEQIRASVSHAVRYHFIHPAQRDEAKSAWSAEEVAVEVAPFGRSLNQVRVHILDPEKEDLFTITPSYRPTILFTYLSDAKVKDQKDIYSLFDSELHSIAQNYIHLRSTNLDAYAIEYARRIPGFDQMTIRQKSDIFISFDKNPTAFNAQFKSVDVHHSFGLLYESLFDMAARAELPDFDENAYLQAAFEINAIVLRNVHDRSLFTYVASKNLALWQKMIWTDRDYPARASYLVSRCLESLFTQLLYTQPRKSNTVGADADLYLIFITKELLALHQKGLESGAESRLHLRAQASLESLARDLAWRERYENLPPLSETILDLQKQILNVLPPELHPKDRCQEELQ